MNDLFFRSRKKKATIVVIDDDPAVVGLLKDDLENEGYLVVTGSDGQMAVSLARTHSPHLIIMDIKMPMTNGIKALEYLRGADVTKEIPVLFISGAKPEEIFAPIANLPRVSFIKKPIELAQLNATVREFLQKYPRAI